MVVVMQNPNSPTPKWHWLIKRDKFVNPDNTHLQFCGLIKTQSRLKENYPRIRISMHDEFHLPPQKKDPKGKWTASLENPDRTNSNKFLVKSKKEKKKKQCHVTETAYRSALPRPRVSLISLVIYKTLYCLLTKLI